MIQSASSDCLVPLLDQSAIAPSGVSAGRPLAPEIANLGANLHLRPLQPPAPPKLLRSKVLRMLLGALEGPARMPLTMPLETLSFSGEMHFHPCLRVVPQRRHWRRCYLAAEQQLQQTAGIQTSARDAVLPPPCFDDRLQNLHRLCLVKSSPCIGPLLGAGSLVSPGPRRRSYSIASRLPMQCLVGLGAWHTSCPRRSQSACLGSRSAQETSDSQDPAKDLRSG
mmetsp:Transcript_43126/g.99352  ORF Transcript_43126/g.99352 Transcript_43126/m.99352 type:complete len:224 (+) Transcript_43126:71-742(+)